MEPEPVLLARIGADEVHIFCGVVSCGGKFAIILEPSPDACEVPERHIFFLPAWAPREDGVWAFSRYAIKRSLKGRKLKFRRTPGLTHGDAIESTIVERLPARAKCPRCGFINTLSPDTLKVSKIMAKHVWPIGVSSALAN